MVVIKRYPNRKLYDTTARRYISLKDVAELVRSEVEIEVKDYASGEDITNRVLVQIIAGQERGPGGALPRPVLASLVHVGSDALSALRRGVDASLERIGADGSEAGGLPEELARLWDAGQQELGRIWRELLQAEGMEAADLIPREEKLAEVLALADLPTRTEVRELSDRLDGLLATLDGMRAADAEGERSEEAQ